MLKISFYTKEISRNKRGLHMNSVLTTIVVDARNCFEQILESVTNEHVDQQIHTVE